MSEILITLLYWILDKFVPDFIKERLRGPSEDSINQHTRDLKEVIKQWKEDLRVPSPRYDFPILKLEGKIGFGDVLNTYNSYTEYDSQKEKFVYKIEKDVLFNDLLNKHIPREYKSIIQEWKDFKNNLKTLFIKCQQLCVKINKESEEKTGLLVKELAGGKKNILSEHFTRSIYETTFDFVIGRSRISNIQYTQEIKNGDVHELWFGDRLIFRGDKDLIDKIQNIHTEMMDSADKYSNDMKQILDLEKEIYDLRGKIDEKLERLLRYTKLQGRCEFLQR